MAKRTYTDRDLNELLQVAADLADEVGRPLVANILRVLPSRDEEWDAMLDEVLAVVPLVRPQEGIGQVGRQLIDSDYQATIQSYAELVADSRWEDQEDLDDEIYRAARTLGLPLRRIQAIFSTEAPFDDDMSDAINRAGMTAIADDLRSAVERILDERARNEG